MAVRRNDFAEELTCPVCKDEFDDPRILPCGHCYCLKCVVQLSYTAGPDPFSCPECRKETVLPSNDASLLPRALLAVRMKEKLQRPGEKLCSKHDEPMKLYCSDCKRTVCINCAFTDHRHSEHNYQLVDVAAQSFAKTVNDKRASLGKQKDALLGAREANKRAMAEVCKKEILIAEDVNSSFDKLLQILKRRRDELLTEASVCIYDTKTALDSQERALSETITQMHCIDKTAEDILINTVTLLERHEEVENNIVKKVEECSKLSLNPAAEAPNMGVQVNCANELAALAKSQCRIIYDTSQFKVTVNGIQSTIDVMCPTMVTLNTSRSTQGTHGEAEVSVRFQHVTTQRKCDVYERGSGVYEFSYCGVTRGQHILSVEEHGKPVLGSPFPVLVTLPPNKLGNIIRVIEPLCHPSSMAFSSNNLIVCEGGSCPRLVVMDRFGQNAFYIKSEDIIRPNGIAVDQDGMMYVTDASSHSLLKFDKCGTLLRKTGSKGNQSGQFNFPTEVLVVNSELIYVADCNNHRIQVFDKNLKFCRKFGSYGSKLGELDCPTDLAYSKNNGFLFITDSNNHRIQVFKLDGKPVKEFSDAGNRVLSPEKKSSNVHVEMEKLKEPWVISLDKTETFLLVADNELGHILVFTAQGTYVSSFSSKGSGRGITRITVDSDGYIYACDSRNNKIIVY